MFFVFGRSVLWVLAFWWFYRERPEDHPHVNRAELAEIRGIERTARSSASTWRDRTRRGGRS
jgi:hypothetical protein